VAAHDGCIEVRSSAGEGTEFSVRIPRLNRALDGPTVSSDD
jgi:signal transduction histidine kinase